MNLTKDQAIIHFNDGNDLYSAKLYEDSLRQYEKAVQLDPTFYNAHFCVAKTKIRLHKITEGVQYFQKYIHLIPQNEQGNYVIALSKILKEENAFDNALHIFEKTNFIHNNESHQEVAYLLLTKDDVESAINHLLQSGNPKQIWSTYQEILFSDNINVNTKQLLEKENIISRFLDTQSAIRELKKTSISHDTIQEKLQAATTLFKGLNKAKKINYNEVLTAIEKELNSIKDILFEYVHGRIKKGSYLEASKHIKLLSAVAYSPEKVQELENLQDHYKKRKRLKKIRLSSISILGGMVFFVAGYFAFTSYQKTEAKKMALESNSMTQLNRFIDTYGDDKEIHNKREVLFYEIAMKKHDYISYTNLRNYYPDSKFLRTISFDVSGEIKTFKVFPISDSKKDLPSNSNKTYKLPLGAKVGYYILAQDMIPVKKYFVVADNITISEVLETRKKVILTENFNSNKNGWKTFAENKASSSKVLQKGIKRASGALTLYSNFNDDQITYTSIPIPIINSNTNFEVKAVFKRDGSDNGSLLFFGSSGRAFNYVGLKGDGSYAYGHNNWNDRYNKWKSQISRGDWREVNREAITTSTNGLNEIRLIKENGLASFYVNEKYVGGFSVKKWYGNQIGFGIYDNTKLIVESLKVYELQQSKPVNFDKGSLYYCWVDELNVRNKGNKNATVVTTIKKGDPVEFLGSIGNKKVSATFKGIFSPDYYYEVKLTDGTIGWVHGGALKEIKMQPHIPLESFKKI